MSSAFRPGPQRLVLRVQGELRGALDFTLRAG